MKDAFGNELKAGDEIAYIVRNGSWTAPEKRVVKRAAEDHVVTEIEGTKYVGGDGKWRSEKYAKETKLTVSRLIVRLGA